MRLERAVDLSTDREGQGAALALLARAAGERGDPTLFDDAIERFRGLLDHGQGQGLLFNPFTFREVQLRGLISTDRIAEAVRIMQTTHVAATPAAPQWHIIGRVTTGQVQLAAGERADASDALRAALGAAESHRLPHQIQRIIRTAHVGGLTEISADGQAALSRLNSLLVPSATNRH
jgi:hypothetical protein